MGGHACLGGYLEQRSNLSPGSENVEEVLKFKEKSGLVSHLRLSAGSFAAVFK